MYQNVVAAIELAMDDMDVFNGTKWTRDLDVFKKNVDNFFLVVMGCIVFLMQCGFAFLEAGSVR